MTGNRSDDDGGSDIDDLGDDKDGVVRVTVDLEPELEGVYTGTNGEPHME